MPTSNYSLENYSLETAIALTAVKSAATVCEKVRFDRPGDAITKPDQSPVTVADFAAQAVICREIATHFPDDPIVGEESSALLQQADMAERLAQVTDYVRAIALEATPTEVMAWIDRGRGQVQRRYWTIDPIDGTKGFLRGDQYAIALALVEDGDVKVGVLGCPALSIPHPHTPADSLNGVIFVAVRGQGTSVISLADGSSYPVAAASNLEGVACRPTESVETEHGDLPRQRAVAVAVGLTDPPLQLDSQVKYGIVACGAAALYTRLIWAMEPDYRENIWDHAAGAIVVEEAGGVVTDARGDRLDFGCGAKLINNWGIVACNRAVHAPILQALTQI